MCAESVRTIAPFCGGKICGVDVPLNAANCGKACSGIACSNDVHALTVQTALWFFPDVMKNRLRTIAMVCRGCPVKC